MANHRWLLTCCILFMTLLQICTSTWPHFNRDFLFLPKLIPKQHLNSPANRETLFEANHPRPRTVIYSRSKLDPTNTNVYQDSATVKISENRSTDKPEEEIIMDDETQLSNNTNVYVPVMVKKKKKNNPNLKKDTTNVRDVSLHGNNFQVTNNNNRRTNPREDFIDEDFLDQSKHSEAPKHQEQDDHHHHRNDHRRANRRNPFNDDSISKDFEDFFKLDDLKDFFDSKIIV